MRGDIKHKLLQLVAGVKENPPGAFIRSDAGVYTAVEGCSAQIALAAGRSASPHWHRHILFDMSPDVRYTRMENVSHNAIVTTDSKDQEATICRAER